MNKKALIIDDDAKIGKLLQAILEPMDFDTVYASNGIEGLQLLTDEQPDIAFLDFQMPGLQGLSVVQMVKNDPKIAHIPIVAVTGMLIEDRDTDMTTFGFAEFIAKPFTPQVIQACVLDILG